MQLWLVGFMAVAAVARFAYATAGTRAWMAPWKYVLAQGPAVWRYLRLILIPYGFSIDPDVHVPPVWLGLLFWAAILGAAVWLFRAYKRPWATWLLGGVLLLLEGTVLFPSAALYADRRMYLPMFAFAAAAGLLFARVKTPAPAAAVAVCLTLLSVVRTTVWMSDRSLWQEAVRRAPGKVRPVVQFSHSLPAAEALELLERTRVTAPHDPSVPDEMGRILLAEHQIDAALIEFGQALKLDPNNAEYYNDRGVALGTSGLTEVARKDFLQALNIDSNLTAAKENLQKLPPAQ